MRYRAILFDMDGVLIDSEALMCKVGILALRDFGVSARAEDFAPFVGRGEDRYLGGVAEKYGVAYRPEMKQRLYAYYAQLVGQEAEVPERVLEVLEALKKSGRRLAVCSSADRVKVEANLHAIGAYEGLFDAVITGTDICRNKPDPEIYLTGAARLSAAPSECLVVEDAPSGLMAAQAGGMDAVGITSSFPEAILCRDVQPKYVIDKFCKLENIVL